MLGILFLARPAEATPQWRLNKSLRRRNLACAGFRHDIIDNSDNFD